VCSGGSIWLLVASSIVWRSEALQSAFANIVVVV